MLRFLGCLALFLAMAGFAMAEEYWPRPKDGIRPMEQIMPHIQQVTETVPLEWRICKTPMDCRLVYYECLNEAMAVHNRYLRAAENYLCQGQPCATKQCAGEPFFRFSADCVQNKCVTHSDVLN